MKQLLLSIISFYACFSLHAQDYSIQSEGVDNNGNYVVRIFVSTKKPSKTPEDLIKQFAVHGIMFRGVAASKEYAGHSSLIKDPNVEQTKKVWFDTFWNEGVYKKFVSITPASLSVMKNKQTKKTETSAIVTVSWSALKKYLEENGIIQGLSNLW